MARLYLKKYCQGADYSQSQRPYMGRDVVGDHMLCSFLGQAGSFLRGLLGSTEHRSVTPMAVDDLVGKVGRTPKATQSPNQSLCSNLHHDENYLNLEIPREGIRKPHEGPSTGLTERGGITGCVERGERFFGPKSATE